MRDGPLFNSLEPIKRHPTYAVYLGVYKLELFTSFSTTLSPAHYQILSFTILPISRHGHGRGIRDCPVIVLSTRRIGNSIITKTGVIVVTQLVCIRLR